ncbi:MAG TPA: ATP-binding protein [Polyangiaceae bacterium]
MPYRESRVEAPVLAPEAGIVDDMVRQFADRHAFLRELVQNGIDAGATRIVVTLARASDGAVTTSVDDDGKGMSRAVIEGPLLTLFQSSKEDDASKIGKYGVGFVSVFATNPSEVEVRTRTGSEAWVVTLLRDYSFELRADESPPGSGTIVTVRGSMNVDEWTEHVAHAHAALRRWCRHARVPIRLEAIDADDPARGFTREIHEVFGLDAPVSVSFQEDGEAWVVGAGATEPRSFAGFYNRGLTLFETQTFGDELEGIHFKIDSPRISHTLSRDNVRRDGELRRVVARARALAEGELWDAIVARSRSDAAAGDGVSLARVLDAAAARIFRKKKRAGALDLPLVDPIEGRTSITIERAVRDGALLVAAESTPLTRELARVGHPVVRPVGLAPHIALYAGNVVHHATELFGVCDASGVALSTSDEALAREIERLLRAADRSLARVRFAAFDGVGHAERCRVVETERDVAATKTTRRKWSSASTLFLNVTSVLVSAARKRASSDVALAAHVVARAVLLDEGPIGKGEVESLLAAVTA